jgi:uncharacterized protein (TIGR03435 family)
MKSVHQRDVEMPESETRRLPVYALVVAKAGPKFKPSGM